MNIDGKDIEMKPAICFDKEYDKWLVSRCGVVWSIRFNRHIKGAPTFIRRKDGSKNITAMKTFMSVPKGFWEDGSGLPQKGNTTRRNIKLHKIVMDTWAPLYDNPPVGMSWETWELLRDRSDAFDWISKSAVIDHIDDDPTNNCLDNLRRVNHWDNQSTRKAKGI